MQLSAESPGDGMAFATLRPSATASHRAPAGPSGAASVVEAPRILEVLLGRSTVEQDDFRLFPARPLIVATVRFDQPVAVDAAHGIPQIELVMGTPPLRQGGYSGRYAGGSGTAELRFHYVPPDRHQDVGHVVVVASAIRLRGGAISAIDLRTAASLTHAAVAEPTGNVDARPAPAIVRTPLPAPEPGLVPHVDGGDGALTADSGPPPPDILRRVWATAPAAAVIPPPQWMGSRREDLIVRHQLRDRRGSESDAPEAVVADRGDTGPAPAVAVPSEFAPGHMAGSTGPAAPRLAAAQSATPRAPRLHVWVRGQTKLTLLWVRGSKSDIEYLVEVSPDGESNWTNVLGAGNYQAVAPWTRDNTYLHEGLQPATTHYYRVAARNGNGFGTPSETESATTNAMVVVPECAGALWSSRITLGEFGAYHDLGYRAGDQDGALSVNRFTLGATAYTVNEVWYSGGVWLYGDGRKVWSYAAYHFALNRAFPQIDRDDLILYVGGVRLPLASAGYTTQPAGHAYRWGGNDEIGDIYDGTFNYVTGDYVPMCLVGPGPRPTLTLRLDPASISEDGGVTAVTATVSAASRDPFTVTVAAAANAPASASDFAFSANRVLTFAANATESTGTVTITARNNGLDAPDQTVRVTGTVSEGARATAPSAVTLTINDDDAASIALAVSPSSIAETGGSAAVTVTTVAGATFGTEQTISLSFAGSATRGDDYTVASDSLVLAANSSSVTTTVTAVSDARDEDDETIEITATHGGSTVRQTITIRDDDALSGAVQPAFLTVDPARAGEADGSMEFEAHAAVPDGQTELTLNYRAFPSPDDTATPGEDFTAMARGTLTLTPSRDGAQLAGSFRIPVLDDELDEEEETFSVHVWLDGTGYDDTASGTIEDDDAETGVTVSDARAVENGGEILFPVRLTRVSGRDVTVNYTTEDGTATAGQDYHRVAARTLTVAAGRAGGTIRVRLRDDDAREGEETFSVRLIDPPTNAVLSGDAVATGTIVDDDGTVAQFWLARFARTTATHAMDAVGDRVTGPPAPPREVTLSGFPVRPGAAAASQEPSEAPVRALAPHELLAGSSFVLSGGEDGGQPASGGGDGHWTFWGRGGVTRLAGKDAAGSEDEMSLNGTIASGTLGVDYDWGPVVAGLAVATTAGGADIAVDAEPAREASAWMVSAHPYARVTVAELVDVWGLLGFGLGAMAVTEDQQIEAGTAMLMGALGARGTLVAPEELAGFGLAVKTDGFVTRIYAEQTAALPKTHADAILVRMIAEGSYRAQLADGSVLTPVVEAGVRFDRGHVETGFGGELGGGVRYVQPAWGLTVTANGRFLLAHQDRGFQEWGLGGSMQLRPDASGRGLTAAMHTSLGMTAGGASGLWADGRPARQRAFDTGAAGGVFDAEVGYGVSILEDTALLTPYAGMTLVDRTANTYRIGGRFDLGPSLSLSLEGERSESAASAPEHGVALRGALRW